MADCIDSFSGRLDIANAILYTVYTKFKDNVWTADLAAMESLPSKNKNVEYLLCVMDVLYT